MSIVKIRVEGGIAQVVEKPQGICVEIEDVDTESEEEAITVTYAASMTIEKCKDCDGTGETTIIGKAEKGLCENCGGDGIVWEGERE